MFKRIIAIFVIITFIFSYYQPVFAQDFSINQLPVPGTMVGESAPFTPLALKGLVINLQKPLEFQFIIDTGNSLSKDMSSPNASVGDPQQEQLKQQANQLVKYFLAGLTIPEKDFWVNLSPYEKNRIVSGALGQTDLGRDLLAEDYILKQLTASLIYPENDLGKEFWSRVYAKAQQQFGTTNIPVNTFNKVWILPDQAQVFEHGAAAYVTKATLKVMLDEDYLSLSHHVIPAKAGIQNTHSLASQIIREIVLPEITKEVNTGKNFATLRQIYQALILAKWYKQTIQNGLLDALYTNKNKIVGVDLSDPAVKEQIYERYLKAYKKGAFNYIKETDTPSGVSVPRKYFSGGICDLELQHVATNGSAAMISKNGRLAVVDLSLKSSAMLSRRQLLGVGASILGAFTANNLLAQQGRFRQEGAVWDDFSSATSKEHIELKGITNPAIYQDGSTHPARETLQVIQNYCDALYVALITASPQMNQIIKIQEDYRRKLEGIIGQAKLTELAEGEDLSKMSFTKFMLTIVNRYLALDNIIMFGVDIPVGSRDSVDQVIGLHAYTINKVEEVNIAPEDLWGQALKVNRVMIGDEISINGRPINRMKAGVNNALAQAAYGNMFFFSNLIPKQYEQLTNIGGNVDEVERQFRATGDQNTAAEARAVPDETMALKYSVNMLRIFLARQTKNDVINGMLEQITRHEGKHLVDNHNQGYGILSAALEVDGHLAGMRKNDAGFVEELTDTFFAIAFPKNSLASQSTDIALKYNLKKIVDYIMAHRADFPMIVGDIFDVYTVKAQLYKLMGNNKKEEDRGLETKRLENNAKLEALRRKMIDAVYYQHQKKEEYGHEEEILKGPAQTIWDDQKVVGPTEKTVAPSGKTIGWTLALVAGVALGSLLIWRAYRINAKKLEIIEKPQAQPPAQPLAHENRKERRERIKRENAGKKNPDQNQAMMSLNRRKFLGVFLGGGLAAVNLLAQQGKLRQEGPVWDDFVSASSKIKINYSGPTKPADYEDGSTDPVRKVLEFIQNFHDALYVELNKKAPQMQEILRLQEENRKSLEEALGKDELAKLAGDEDISKMSYTRFMLVIINRYLARYNIVMFGVLLPVGSRDSADQVVTMHFYKIDNVEKASIGPEDLWGQALNADKVMLGGEVSIKGREINRMKAGAGGFTAKSAYGNMFFINDVMRNQYSTLINIGGNVDVVEGQFEAVGVRNTVSDAREANNENIALKYSVNMLRIALARSENEVFNGGMEQQMRHQGKILVDDNNNGHAFSSTALDVDGHLAGMRKNDVGWTKELMDVYLAIEHPSNSLATQTADISQKYILKKIVDYIRAHQSEFPMDKVNFFDDYTVKAQLYKLMGNNKKESTQELEAKRLANNVKLEALRRKMIDAIYYQHQKPEEYGHEEEILQGPAQTVWDDQKIFGFSKTDIIITVAAGVAVGILLKWNFKRKDTIQEKPAIPANLTRTERRRLERQALKDAKNKKPGSSSAMLSLNRRQFLGTLAMGLTTALGGGKLAAQQASGSGPVKPVWNEYMAALKERVTFKGVTKPNIYAENSKDTVRKALELIFLYQYTFFGALLKEPTNYDDLDKLQQALRHGLEIVITPQEIKRLAEGKDTSKMSFTTFMLVVIARYFAQNNIIMLGEVYTPKNKNSVPKFDFYEIDKFEEGLTLNPEDLWGAPLTADRINIGKEILIRGQRMSPIKNSTIANALSANGNLFFYINKVKEACEKLVQVGDLKQAQEGFKTLSDEKVVLSSRKSGNEANALKYAVALMRMGLVGTPIESLMEGYIESSTYHEGKHAVDQDKLISVALEVDGHLAGMRKNQIGWVQTMYDSLIAAIPSGLDLKGFKDTDTALNYIMKKMVDYIQSPEHRSEFPMIEIEGDVFDAYTIKAQLYKLMGNNKKESTKELETKRLENNAKLEALRRKMIDAIYYQHQKPEEYGHEEEILKGPAQAIRNDQKVVGPSEKTVGPSGKTIGWTLASVAGVAFGSFLIWRANRINAKKAGTLETSKQPPAESRQVRRARQRAQQDADKKKKRDLAQLTNGGIDLNQINVDRIGKRISVQFDQAQLNELEQSDFKGFRPEITGFRYIQSPFPLLGVNNPAKEPEVLAKT